MRIAAPLFSAALCCALLAPAPAAAQEVRLPVGSSHGVRVVSHGGLAAFVFTPRAYRRVAGRRVSIGCTHFGPPRLALSSEDDATERFRAPKRRHTLETIS